MNFRYITYINLYLNQFLEVKLSKGNHHMATLPKIEIGTQGTKRLVRYRVRNIKPCCLP